MTSIYLTGERVRVTFEGDVRDVDHAGYLTVNVASATVADRIALPLDVGTITIERLVPVVERGVLYRCVLGQSALGVELEGGVMAVCWPDGSISPVSELGSSSLPLVQVWPPLGVDPVSEDDEGDDVEDSLTHRSGVSAARSLRLVADALAQLGTARLAEFYVDVNMQVAKSVVSDEGDRVAAVYQLAGALDSAPEIKPVTHGRHLVARDRMGGVEATVFTALEEDTDPAPAADGVEHLGVGSGASPC